MMTLKDVRQHMPRENAYFKISERSRQDMIRFLEQYATNVKH